MGSCDTKMSTDEKMLPTHQPNNTNQNTLLTELQLLSILTFFSIWGGLARKAITLLTTYPSSYLGGVIWANFTSCLIMGALTRSERVWTAFNRPKAQVLLYTGLTTGFCGTFSSFSSMMLEAFVKSADVEIGNYSVLKNGGYGIMECLSVLIGHTCVSLLGVQIGRHFSESWDTQIGGLLWIQRACMVGGVLCYIAVVCLMAIPGWRSWMFSCVVAPFGCFARYYISKWLNPRVKSFPMGTFTVNVASTLILAVLNLVNRGKVSGGGTIVTTVLSCHMIQGLEDGFCGAMSTVSTWAVELYTLGSPNCYKYGLVSLAVTYIMMVVILGSYNWTQGLTDPLCS